MSQSKLNKENMTDESKEIRGRSIFIVETTAAGVAVRTGFLSDEGSLIPMSAVFPTLEYALSQIDELKKIVNEQFSRATLVGIKTIASEQAKKIEEVQTTGPLPGETIQ